MRLLFYVNVYEIRVIVISKICTDVYEILVIVISKICTDFTTFPITSFQRNVQSGKQYNSIIGWNIRCIVLDRIDNSILGKINDIM